MKKTISLLNIVTLLSFVAIIFILVVAIEESYKTKENFHKEVDNHMKVESLGVEEIISNQFSRIYEIFNQTINIDLKKLKDAQSYFSSIDDYMDPIVKLLNKDTIFGNYNIYLFDREHKTYKSPFGIDNVYNLFKMISFEKIDTSGLFIDMSPPIYSSEFNDFRRYLLSKSKNGDFFIQISHNYDFIPSLKRQIEIFKRRFRDIILVKLYIISNDTVVDILAEANRTLSKDELQKKIAKDLQSTKEISLDYLEKLKCKIDEKKEIGVSYSKFDIGFNDDNRNTLILKLKFNLHEKFITYQKEVFRLWVIIILSFILIFGIIVTIKILVVDNIYKIIMALNRKHVIKSGRVKIREFEILINTIEKYREALYKRNRELESLASVDSMTKCLNRRVFNEKLDEYFYQYKRYGRGFGLIIFDIDNFKQINDIYGHRRGDLVLIELAQRVQEHIRRSDLFFRIGGEEFAILVLTDDEQEIVELAEKIKDIVQSKPFDGDLKVTISVGVDILRDDADSISLFNRIDKYTYISKQRGKNRVTSISDAKEQEPVA